MKELTMFAFAMNYITLLISIFGFIMLFSNRNIDHSLFTPAAFMHWLKSILKEQERCKIGHKKS